MSGRSTGQPLRSFRHIQRGGSYYRICDPDWADPLDGNFAKERGGRWNPPESFAVVYLNASHETARANIVRRFRYHSFSPDDVMDEHLPMLVETVVPADDFVDVITEQGCHSAGLPNSYPLDSRGREIARKTCHLIGQAAYDKGEAGIASRSAATPRPPFGEELAWFQRNARLKPGKRSPFEDWYFVR